VISGRERKLNGEGYPASKQAARRPSALMDARACMRTRRIGTSHKRPRGARHCARRRRLLREVRLWLVCVHADDASSLRRAHRARPRTRCGRAPREAWLRAQTARIRRFTSCVTRQEHALWRDAFVHAHHDATREARALRNRRKITASCVGARCARCFRGTQVRMVHASRCRVHARSRVAHTRSRVRKERLMVDTSPYGLGTRLRAGARG
jgi:hypothetical protein